MLVGYDMDGVLTAGVRPGDDMWVVISGRTWAEYDDFARTVAAQVPVYIRGSGVYGDREGAARFKAMMINRLGVDEFHEDDPKQADIIRDLCPGVEVVMVK
jgi:hypothetical protein